MDRITLDREVFKALASDTRLDILKALDVRQKTVTELAKELSLNKATVFEHLEKLATVGLIQKLEDDRKWVYWQLTWTGRRLLHPEKITLALVLSSAMGSFLTAIVAAWMYVRSRAYVELPSMKADGMATESAPAEEGARTTFADSAMAAPPPTPELVHDPVLLATAVFFGLVFVGLLVWGARVWRRSKAAQAAPAA